ncbi:hypothetical protein PoB_004780500 [Plakobranchus ocellatus]|uniref:Uncharacterized protein n=1 Tax=Plakobranchus ocellatus TaxID=259542 RepID=A0AAV4BQD0_9GAST|nr:hypothetical protein PoB_004780500 [Plakobranchus ocellatus]
MPASAPLCGGAFLPEREATLMDRRQILNNRKQSCLNLSLSVEQDSIKCSLLSSSSINHKGSPDATTKSCSDASRLNQPIKNCPSERCLASATPNNISTAAVPADVHLYPSCPDSVQCDNDIFERLMSANVSETPAHAATIQCPHDGHTSACFHRCRESKTYIALTLYIVLALLNGCASASKDFYFPDSTQGKLLVCLFVVLLKNKRMFIHDHNLMHSSKNHSPKSKHATHIRSKL